MAAAMVSTEGPSTTVASSSSSPAPRHLLPVIKSVYITVPAPFDQVETFVDESIARYNLDLVRIEGPMKTGLTKYLDMQKSTVEGAEGADPKSGSISAILVGTRRNDPDGGAFTSTRQLYWTTSDNLRLCSVFGIHNTDGSWLAAILARPSDHQLELSRRLGLLARAECPILRAVRQRVWSD